MGTVVRAVARACARSSAAMKLNIAYPTNGTQKKVEVNEDQKLLPFFDKRISAEGPGDSLGDEFKGYIFKIMGGQDKQGFPMKQGVLTSGRVRVLMERGQTVRGCIVSQDLSTLNLKVVKVGDAAIPGLTDTSRPKMRGPKRASKIRKLFALNKGDDVRAYDNTYRRDFETKNGSKQSKAPKIQRLVTPLTLQRKRARKAIKVAKIAKSKGEAQATSSCCRCASRRRGSGARSRLRRSARCGTRRRRSDLVTIKNAARGIDTKK